MTKVKNKIKNLIDNYKTSAFYEIYSDCKFFLEKHKYIPTVLLVIILSISFMLVPMFDESKKFRRRTDPVKNEERNIMYAPIYVTIAGEVKKPGMYEMTEKDRINDLILKAGGFTDKAYTDNVNLSQKLTDEQHIYIPSVDENNLNNAASNVQHPNIGIININTASIDELTKLPNIGKTTANSILEYRDKNGNFDYLEEIMNVKGIGEKTFNEIKPYITV